MTVLEILLNKRWILKSREKELYYKVKDDIGEIKRFLTEKLGYQLIVNPYLIKVEKIPAEPQNWMGILDFKDKTDYLFFCYVLMFLEDKETEEQFVLSELTEYIQSQCKEIVVDWTIFQQRRCLIRVIKYCAESGMLAVNDGDEEEFARDYSSEVLYENTGVSRYFMKNFTTDIMSYTAPSDFEKAEWLDVKEDRGIVRRQRVYRSILMSMGMFKTEETEEDFAYIRNYRKMISGELEELLDCELQIHRTSAFLILGERCRLGRTFPEENTVSDIVLLCCGLLQKEIKNGNIQVPADECICLSAEQYEQILEKCKSIYGKGFNKTYREKTTAEFTREIAAYMEELQLIRKDGREVCLSTVIGKIAGEYPADFKGGKDE
jgi:uncharacterized protein (TIGR02678 family)